MASPQVGRSIRRDVGEAIVGVEDVATSVLGRGFPVGGLQHIAVGFVHEAEHASSLDDFDVTESFLKAKLVLFEGETMSFVTFCTNLLATSVEGGERFRELGVNRCRHHGLRIA